MDFTLTDEQEELRGLARQILTDRTTLGGLRAFDESTDWFDRDTWAEFAKANLLGAALPESVGGLGFGFLETCLILEEQGRAVTPMPLLHTLVSCAATVAKYGNDEQRAEWLASAPVADPSSCPAPPNTTDSQPCAFAIASH